MLTTLKFSSNSATGSAPAQPPSVSVGEIRQTLDRWLSQEGRLCGLTQCHAGVLRSTFTRMPRDTFEEMPPQGYSQGSIRLCRLCTCHYNEVAWPTLEQLESRSSCLCCYCYC